MSRLRSTILFSSGFKIGRSQLEYSVRRLAGALKFKSKINGDFGSTSNEFEEVVRLGGMNMELLVLCCR
jgi:hypothetical protein